MDISLYIPKWMIVGFLFGVGCIVGWMLHTSADGVVRPTTLQNGSPIGGPPAGWIDGTGAYSGTVSATDTAVRMPDPATPNAAAGASLYGDASTGNSNVHVSAAPLGDGSWNLRGDASTVNSMIHAAYGPSGSYGDATTPNSNVRVATGYWPPSVADWQASQPGAGTWSGAGSPWGNPTVPVPPNAPMPAPGVPVTPQQWPTLPPVPGLGSFGPPSAQPVPASPPFFGEALFTPLPGTQSRGIAFSEWESYRTDVAGRNILVTTDDSNFFRDRNGKINGNTGDTDASGLNVIGATDSVIRGSESADEAPYQTVVAGLVDLASDAPGGGLGSDPDDDPDDEDDGNANAPDPGANPPPPFAADALQTTMSSDPPGEVNGDTVPGPGGVAVPVATQATQGTQATQSTSPNPTPVATAAVVTSASSCDPDGDDCGDDSSAPEEFDFPYTAWTQQINGSSASAVHTDEGTTLASGQEALVIGADGYDDDDNRAAGENITITRDDGNVVIGGTGDVNAQIGDSEQGAVIMDVTRTFIQGGGAY